MTDQTVNIPLLRKAVEWAEAEAAKPAIDCQWVQDGWRTSPRRRALELLDETPLEYSRGARSRLASHCETAYCIAGWTLHEAGWAAEKFGAADPDLISAEAAELLGIADWEGTEPHLFHEDNSIEDVRRIAEDLAGERL